MTHAPFPSMPPYFNVPRRIAEAHEWLMPLYDAWGKPAQAAERKTKLDAFQQAAKLNHNKAQTA